MFTDEKHSDCLKRTNLGKHSPESEGAQKQMIVVRTGNSPYFDEAYFVLRRDIRPEKQERPDILSEANRILHESGGGNGRRSARRKRDVLWALFAFLVGVAVGIAVHVLL